MLESSFFHSQIDTLGMVEDYFQEDYTKEKKTLYWGRLAEIIQKFDQIMDIEKKQVQQSIAEIVDKKGQYLKALIDFKFSLKTQGQNKAVEYIIIQHQKINKFFQKQLNQIVELITYFVKNPQQVSHLLRLYEDRKKFNFNDFALNIVNLFYSFYYLYEKFDTQSQYYRFSTEIFKDWNYDIENCRMKYHSLHNQIILSSFKNPMAECFIQKIAIQLILTLENAQPFVFDLDTIKLEMEQKRITQKSFMLPEKKQGFFASIRSTFKPKAKTDERVNYGQNSSDFQNEAAISIQKQALAIQKLRHQQFVKILRHALDLILREDLPIICKLIMRKFKRKLDSETKGKINDYTKHYCNLLLTNWILSEFHYKFTMSHDQKEMTNIQLQNISQLLRALTLVFQQSDSGYDKNIFFRNIIQEYRQKVYSYYQNALESDIFSIGESQISSYLVRYQHSLKMFSLNDIRIFCDLMKLGIQNQTKMNISNKLKQFLLSSNNIYNSRTKVSFRGGMYDAQNIYFMLKVNQTQIVQQTTQYYLGKEYPLNQLPLLTQTLLKSSNLSIGNSLQVSQSLEFLKKLNSKQILKNLAKVEQNFKNLKINETAVLNYQFTKSFHEKIRKNLIKKTQLIRHKQNICSQITSVIQVIEIYRKKMKSETFYKNVTNHFINIVKIKVYVGIESGILEVYKQFPEKGRKLQISHIIMSKKMGKEKEKQSAFKNNVLAQSFKSFESIAKVIQWIADVDPTKKAFLYGRKMEEFNLFFKTFCTIISQYIQQFIKSQKYLQHLDLKKFESLINQRLGQMLLSEMGLIEDVNKKFGKDSIEKSKENSSQIDKDKNFLKKISNINEDLFYKKQLAQLQIQNFLFQEAVFKFNELESKTTAKQKISQFDTMIKMIFSILNLSISRDKITAEVITPIIQYVILKSKNKYSYKNLFIIQCLLSEYNVETSYLLTLWDSALTYLSSLTNQILTQ